MCENASSECLQGWQQYCLSCPFNCSQHRILWFTPRFLPHILPLSLQRPMGKNCTYFPSRMPMFLINLQWIRTIMCWGSHITMLNTPQIFGFLHCAKPWIFQTINPVFSRQPTIQSEQVKTIKTKLPKVVLYWWQQTKLDVFQRSIQVYSIQAGNQPLFIRGSYKWFQLLLSSL